MTLSFIETGDAKATSVKHNVPLSTVYRWYEKYRTDKDKGLVNKSTKPHNSPNKTSDKNERIVLHTWYNIKTKRNYSNVKKILDGKGIILSLPTIKKILHRINHTS